MGLGSWFSTPNEIVMASLKTVGVAAEIMKPMRILVIHNRYREFGGEDAVVDGEIELLRGAGHDVQTLLWSNDDIRTDGPLRKAAALANATWSRSAWQAVRRTVRDSKPDVVHVHNTVAAASPAVVHAAAVPGVGIVHTLHNYRHLCLNGLLFRNERLCTDCVGRLPWRGVTRACYRGSRSESMALAFGEVVHRALGSWSHVHRFIVFSEHAKRLHVEAGFDAQRIALKPQTLATDPGVGQHRGAFALFAGRLAVGKGVGVLLHAWKESRLDLPLVIAGDGPEAERVRRDVVAIPGAKMLGQITRPQLMPLMHDACLLVVPSLWFEGFPVTLLEGLATGCPVVASDVGALREIIRSGENGVLVQPGDSRALGKVIRGLIESPGERERLARGARASYQERFSPERSRQTLERIYQEAIAAARDAT